MTLVSSARRHDLNVRIYLKDVLDQLLAGCTDYTGCCRTSGSKAIWRRSASTACKSVGTRPSVSNSKPPVPSGPPPPPLTPRAPGRKWCC